MIRENFREQLITSAKKRGLGKAVDLLLAEAQECAYITIAKRRRPSDDEPGASRIGGMPDLPRNAQWPCGLDKNGKPFGYARFLAQFNLADIPALEGLPLPKRGHLWLFFQSLEDYNTIHVAAIHDPNSKGLHTRKPPTKTDWGHNVAAYGAPPGISLPISGSLAIRFERGISLPYRESLMRLLWATIDPRAAAEEGWSGFPEDVMRVLTDLENPDARDGQVGGRSAQLDGDLYRVITFRQLGRPEMIYADSWASIAEYEKSLRNLSLSGGFLEDVYDSSRKKRSQVEWIDRHRAQIAVEASTWQLLFSFRSSLMDFGAPMYFDVFIRWADLVAMRFDRLQAACRSIT